MNATTEISVALRGISPTFVQTGVREIAGTDERLLRRDEFQHVRYATAGRRREFAAGRVLLRQLMRTDVSILVQGNRAPQLPDRFRGSLAHDERYAVAAVADRRDVTALGIDLEPEFVDQDEMLAQVIVRPDEGDLDPSLAFCVKEAAFKAWSSMGGTLVAFQDVHVDVNQFDFRARFPDCDIHGRFAKTSGRWIALAVVPSEANQS